MAEILIMTDSNYKELVMSTKRVLVDLYADWCGPCKMLSPVLEQVANEMSDDIAFAKLNIDENENVANALNAQSIPYLVLFEDGRVVDSVVGFRPKEDIVNWLKANINK